ncbi:MAG: FecR family protein [Sphingobacteriales bacterium]|nr:FecR family protein [Sphingobacteriales bacterium]OJW00125.1 MAG: hypothetical protein BGO52_03290 [Sphingobacteriales bacterium 44-61]
MPELKLLVQKYWAGTIQAEEMKQLHKLLAEAGPEKVEALFQQLDADDSIGHKIDSEYGYDKILDTIHVRLGMKSKKNFGKLRQLNYRRIAAVAASMAAIVWLGFLLKPENRHNRPGIAYDPASMKVLRNNSDTILSLLLPDHTTALLYPNSQLLYANPFSGKQRNVQLSGVAEFDVAKDSTRPFTVFANDIKTTALGTRFKVDAATRQVQVLLFEGKVLIRPVESRKDVSDIFLVAGQQVSFSEDMRYRVSLIPDTKSSSSAKLMNGYKKEAASPAKTTEPLDLNFENIPLDIVIRKIQQEYKIHIILDVADYHKQMPLFTGSFTEKDSLQDVLRIICNMNDLNYRTQRDTIIVTKK